MMKKIIFCFLFSLTLTYAYGLRNLSIGDKFPLEGKTAIFNSDMDKLILFGNSKKVNTKNYLKTIFNILINKKVEFFFVDTNATFEQDTKQIFESYTGIKKYVEDPEKEIFGKIGVIVLPTLLLVNKTNTLHSYIAGEKNNLNLTIEEDLNSMVSGKEAGNIFKKFNAKTEENKYSQKHNQAYKMFINGDYALSATIFKKLNEEKSSDDGELGYIYSLILDGKEDEALIFFNSLSDEKKNENRFTFSIALINGFKTPNKDNFELIAKTCHYETKYFTVIFRAANHLYKNGEIELSAEIYKQAYKVLWNTYRRKK